jgi:hypothetical protein
MISNTKTSPVENLGTRLRTNREKQCITFGYPPPQANYNRVLWNSGVLSTQPDFVPNKALRCRFHNPQHLLPLLGFYKKSLVNNFPCGKATR